MSASPTIRGIPELVAPRFGVTVGELLSRRRDRRAARARQVAMWISRRVATATLPEIGCYFERDHTTVIQAVRRIDALIEQDAALAAAVWEVVGLIDSDAAASLRKGVA